MHAGAALRDELADRRVVAERCEELDPAVADAHRRGLDALGLDACAVLEAAAEEALIRAHRFVEVRDGDADVVDASCFHPVDASRCRSGGGGLDAEIGAGVNALRRDDARHPDRVGGA